jgi:hypothetical protein
MIGIASRKGVVHGLGGKDRALLAVSLAAPMTDCALMAAAPPTKGTTVKPNLSTSRRLVWHAGSFETPSAADVGSGGDGLEENMIDIPF